MAILDTNNRAHINAFAQLDNMRLALLNQLESTAQNANATIKWWNDIEYAIMSEGSIGSVWVDASIDQDQYKLAFGESIAAVLLTLANVIDASWVIRERGELFGLAILQNLPERIAPEVPIVEPPIEPEVPIEPIP